MNLVSFSLCSDPIVEIAISIHAYTQATEACDVLAAKCGWNVDGKAEPTKDYEKSEGPGQAGINWNQHKKLEPTQETLVYALGWKSFLF